MTKYDATTIEAAAKQTVADMETKVDENEKPVRITRAQLAEMSPGAALAAMKNAYAGKAQLVD